jgi:hypothetical protein
MLPEGSQAPSILMAPGGNCSKGTPYLALMARMAPSLGSRLLKGANRGIGFFNHGILHGLGIFEGPVGVKDGPWRGGGEVRSPRDCGHSIYFSLVPKGDLPDTQREFRRRNFTRNLCLSPALGCVPRR